MSPGSVREYAADLRVRYRRASRNGKSRILDEVVAVTGYHRKSAIRLLRRNCRNRGERLRAAGWTSNWRSCG